MMIGEGWKGALMYVPAAAWSASVAAWQPSDVAAVICQVIGAIVSGYILILRYQDSRAARKAQEEEQG